MAKYFLFGKYKMTMMNEQQTADALGLSKRTLQRMRENHTGPAFHRFGKRIGYKMADLEEFMKMHRHQNSEHKLSTIDTAAFI